MSYPERGATYRNKPAWMDRAVASEKRADGGSLAQMEPLIDEKGSPNPSNYFDHLVEPSSPHAAQDARDQAAERTRRAAVSPRTPGPITKSLVAAGAAPLVLGRMTADTVKGVADRINSPDAKDQIAEGMGRSNRRRGGRT